MKNQLSVIKSYKNLGILFFSLILALALIIISLFQKSNKASLNTNLTNHMPEFVIVKGTSTEYNELGQFAYNMSADKLSYYAQGDFSDILNPRIKIRDKENKLWLLSAEQGVFNGKQSTLTLSESVKVAPDPEFISKNKSNLHVFAQHLIVNTRKSTIETHEKISIISNNGEIESTGLKADLNEGQAWLHANVKASHKPFY